GSQWPGFAGRDLMMSLEELGEAHSKSQRLLDSLARIPVLLSDEEAWAGERREVFGLLRRGLVDCITTGCLEAPIFGNLQIESAFIFLLTLGSRSERRQESVLTCFKALRTSESWAMALRGSRKVLELLKELPEEFRAQVLDVADASELALLLGREKKKKKKKSRSTTEHEAPTAQEAQTSQEAQKAQEELEENSQSLSADFIGSCTCPEDLLAETFSQSDGGLELRRASRTCPEDLLAEPSLSLSIHTPEPEASKPPSPALPSAALQRPPLAGAAVGTPSRVRNFGGGWPLESPASKPKRPGEARRKKDFAELGPRCPNGKSMTREQMMKEGQLRRSRDSGSRTPALRRLLSGGAASPPSGADTPSGLIGRMAQRLLPSRASPSPSAPHPMRDFGGGDRFGVVASNKVNKE
ncbi:unnamed protein product, partial [Effrenium voratum]